MPTLTWPTFSCPPSLARLLLQSPGQADRAAAVRAGLNLLEAAAANGVPRLAGECGDCLSCATCHVFVDPARLDKTGPADKTEDAMLAMTEVERRGNSRLSCRLTASPELDGRLLPVPAPD